MIRVTRRVAPAVARRPDLWWVTLALLFRLIPRQWWRRGLTPPKEYLDYRASAVYGLPLGKLRPDEFIRYLEWCKAFPAPIT
jgi:hypothetical protein